MHLLVEKDDSVAEASVAHAPNGYRLREDADGRVLQVETAAPGRRLLRRELAVKLGRKEAHGARCMPNKKKTTREKLAIEPGELQSADLRPHRRGYRSLTRRELGRAFSRQSRRRT